PDAVDINIAEPALGEETVKLYGQLPERSQILLDGASGLHVLDQRDKFRRDCQQGGEPAFLVPRGRTQVLQQLSGSLAQGRQIVGRWLLRLRRWRRAGRRPQELDEGGSQRVVNDYQRATT